MSKVPKRGDFLKVRTSKGTRYMRFLGPHQGPRPMGVFAVLENVDWQEVDFQRLARLKPQYFIGALAMHLARDSNFSVVPGSSVPPLDIPRFWRYSRLKGWSVVENGQEGPRQEINDTIAALPIIESAIPSGIIDRLLSGWTPETARADSFTRLLDAVRDQRKNSQAGTLTVFLDFATEDSAIEAAEQFKSLSYKVSFLSGGKSLSVTCQSDRSRENWISASEQRILAVAGRHGGEYDGNEISL